ncbi:hypothetical protein KMZ30_07400 [Phycicoccus sp. KQZ13P-1]|uniref:hypothetical protein n=1 Tax=Phycicoccus mangrovi TaxID=2840470 RepID=UPI001C006CCB|nr:hypothetical protein [Phycicoccus mangrovi]MBT9255397.1 hypothetical protein [Phycicoccus mangrovi]
MLDVIVSDNGTSRPPTDGEDARRIVRHGMAEILEWLGEPVGPKPGEPVHRAFLIDRAAFMFYGAVPRVAAPGLLVIGGDVL